MIKKMVCIQCPRGCHLEIDTETLKVTGNFCPRGVKYAQSEITCPERTITSTVIVHNAKIARCSVRTTSPVPKDMIFKVMDEINKVEVTAPCKVGDVVIKNVCGSKADVILTKNLEKVD